MDPNDALSSLGRPWTSPWQMTMYNLIIAYMGIIASWQMMAIVFIGGDPPHRCRLPDAVSANESIPYRYIDGVRRFDSCVVYENYSSDTNWTIPCPHGWEYEHDSFTITEQTMLVIGVLTGAVTMTRVADKFGRKWTFLANACIGSFVVFLTALVDNYYLFTALRFLLGIFLQARAATRNNIELPKKYRHYPKDNTSSVYIFENGDKVATGGSEATTEHATKSDSQEYSLIDIMSSHTLRLYSAALFYLWFVICLVYYGLSLNSGTLAGNKYVNFALSGAVEIPATLFCIPLYNRFGRIRPMCILLVISGVSLLITLVIQQTTGTGMQLLAVAFSMISKFSISAAFAGIFLITPELYPTTVRNVGLGIGSVGGRFGSMFAPYSTYFARLAPWVPGLAFGILSVIGGAITLLLPETRDRPLPQTIEEVEQKHSAVHVEKCQE
ncbi:hypothetical protein NP493_846g01005 [Ridgeia piscesae]|uniref:Uncharacterized protein n=1 Tax=Ridgeia piscesae TaxID=27915 RepID=A0AAD9KM53_RIDPI|nr:hypothetical protein NP493_846g01005 [Ridgeia piscesae]